MNRIEDVTNYITECDKEVGEALALELGRQRRNLELIASENIVSPAVMLAMEPYRPISMQKVIRYLGNGYRKRSAGQWYSSAYNVFPIDRG